MPSFLGLDHRGLRSPAQVSCTETLRNIPAATCSITTSSLRHPQTLPNVPWGRTQNYLQLAAAANSKCVKGYGPSWLQQHCLNFVLIKHSVLLGTNTTSHAEVWLCSMLHEAMNLRGHLSTYLEDENILLALRKDSSPLSDSQHPKGQNDKTNRYSSFKDHWKKTSVLR